MTSPRGPSNSPARTYSRRVALRLAGGTAAAAFVAACGGGDGGTRDEPAGDTLDLDRAVTEFTIVAKNIKWDLDRVVVPAGQEITATIDNRDRGILHNLHVKSPGDPKTELEKGPVIQTLRFTIDKSGSYEFVCDAHLNMTGTVEAV